MRLILLFKNAFLQLCGILFMFTATCITETACSSYDIRKRLARHTIVEAKNKSRFDFKLALKRKNNIYVEENTNRAFLLELLLSQIRLLLPHGATQTAQLRRVCNNYIK